MECRQDSHRVPASKYCTEIWDTSGIATLERKKEMSLSAARTRSPDLDNEPSEGDDKYKMEQVDLDLRYKECCANTPEL